MAKCEYCGKEIGLLAVRYTWLDKQNNRAMHDECYEKYMNESPEKADVKQSSHIGIESEKKKKNEEKIIDSTKRSNEKVRWGWMGFFIVVLVVISPLYSVYTLFSSWGVMVANDLFNLYPKTYLLSIIDVVISIFLIIFSIYVGLSLYYFKDRALLKTKLYLIVFLIYGIIAPFSIYFVGYPQDALNLTSSSIGTSIFRTLIFFGVWYWFITSSKTVERIYFDKV